MVTDEEWVRENTGKHFCQCGCGKPVGVAWWNRERGIPKFVRGHNARKQHGDPDERFWSSVQKSDGCWVWTANRPGGRYGTLQVSGRKIKAHRYSWEIHFGPIPDGMEVMHECDNTGCVRPDHLRLGTHLDNMRDCSAKGRSSRGERSGRSILTEDGARSILRRVAAGDSRKQIAADLGVAKSTVDNVVLGRSWRHIA